MQGKAQQITKKDPAWGVLPSFSSSEGSWWITVGKLATHVSARDKLAMFVSNIQTHQSNIHNMQKPKNRNNHTGGGRIMAQKGPISC